VAPLRCRGRGKPPLTALTTAKEAQTDMSVPTRPAVDDATADALAALALGRTEMLEQAEDLRDRLRRSSGLDPRSFSLVKIAALVALDAPPASFLWQVGQALDSGAEPREILGVLTAIAPQVGLPRVVAAAPEIMLALDLELPDDDEDG
jgi:4-carboxymuconolactone decarboxylase